jgi:hypothetical protein
MLKKVMTRTRAALLHLGISGTIVALVLAVVFFAWYPGWSFKVAGAVTPVMIMVGVDLVLGPLLTLIVYKKGKPGLKFDLAFIAIVQLVALSYGSLTLYNARPHFLVFAVDRVVVVARKHVNEELIAYPEIRELSPTSIIRVVSRAPEDPEAFQKFLNSTLFDGQPDLEYRTEFWEPWLDGSDLVRDGITLLDDFEPADEREIQQVAKARERFAEKHPLLGFLAVGAIEEDIGLLIDAESLEILGVIRVNPW